MSTHQLRILASASTAASTSSSTGEQGPAALYEQMAELFQLTPLPQRRTTLTSPSAVAIDALLNDIGDPQRLLHEMVTASASAPARKALHRPESALKATNKRETMATEQNAPTGDKDSGAAKKAKRATTSAARTSMRKNLKLNSVAEAQSSASIKAELARISQSIMDDPDSREVVVNVSRARQKEEMAHLRVKVRELERELLKLGNKSQQHASTLAPASNSSSTPPADKQMQQSNGWTAPRKPIWERLANGAKDRKHDSEVENLRLRETVAMQAKLSKSLEKILMKRANLSILGGPPQPAPPATRTRFRAPDDPASAAEGNEDELVFQELSSQLDLQYQQLDGMLKDTELATKSTEWQSCEATTSGGGPMTIECCDIKHFPFAVDAVADAAWRCATVTVIKDVNCVAEVVHQTESVAHTRTTITVKRLNCPDLELKVKSVVKRFTEPTRRVFLLNSVTGVLIPSKEAQGPASKSLEISDQGWATIESISDDARLPASILRIRMHAQLSEPEPAHSLSRLLVDTCTQMLHARQQLMENFLLESAITKNTPL